jgi:DNA-binding FrmR family transcriptional regulator
MHKFPEIATRLKRAQGHLAAVIDMLEAGRPCMDLAQQLHAVEKAIGNAKKELIKDHIHTAWKRLTTHCRARSGI